MTTNEQIIGESILRYLAENTIYETTGVTTDRGGKLHKKGFDYRFGYAPVNILTTEPVKIPTRLTPTQYEKALNCLLGYMALNEYTAEEQEKAQAKFELFNNNGTVLPFLDRDLTRKLNIDVGSKLGALAGYRVRVKDKVVVTELQLTYGVNSLLPLISFPMQDYGTVFKLSGVNVETTARGEIKPATFTIDGIDYVLDNLWLYKKTKYKTLPIFNTVTGDWNTLGIKLVSKVQGFKKYQKAILPLALYKQLYKK